VAVEAFYLGKYELTQSQWQTLMGTNPSVHQGKEFADAEKMPVEHVSWQDCQALLRPLNERVPGAGFRLPTEAEWEYACRAGSRPPPEGSALGQFAWFRANSVRQPRGENPSQDPNAWSPRPVGTKKPNPWGLYDMQGNVAEWCSSLYRPYLYDAKDGRESPDGPGLRVVRGGSYADSAEELDPALRHGERPQRRFRWNGVRIARSVP
jgi:formylglycine-generating enzyme required for sulfatase activity